MCKDRTILTILGFVAAMTVGSAGAKARGCPCNGDVSPCGGDGWIIMLDCLAVFACVQGNCECPADDYDVDCDGEVDWCDVQIICDQALGVPPYDVYCDTTACGACCLADDSCTHASNAFCDDEDGAYLGDDTECVPNPCNPARLFLVPRGADPAGTTLGEPVQMEAPPFGLVTVEVWVENTGRGLGEYQIYVPCSATGLPLAHGSVSYGPWTVSVDEAHDGYVFDGFPHSTTIASNDCCAAQPSGMGGLITSGSGPEVTTPKYLGEFVYKVLGDSAGTHRVTIDPDPLLTFLDDDTGAPIALTTDVLEINVVPRPYGDIQPCGGDNFLTMLDVMAVFNTMNAPASALCPDPAAHGCCDVGVASCNDVRVADCVCATDPDCCAVSWTDTCVAEVESLGCSVCVECP